VLASIMSWSILLVAIAFVILVIAATVWLTRS
jgi:hypothetical protein